MPNAPSRWEPYCHRPDAEFHLSKFAGEVLGHDAGVIFFDGSGSARLKSASPDKDGDTTDLIVSVARAPSFPFAFRGQPEAQSFSQFARERTQGMLREASAAASSLKSAYSHATAPVAKFIENHKTAVDGVNTVVDTWGVMSGFLAASTIVVEGVTLAPALAVVALVGAALLLVADGTMFCYEITGNEVRKKRLENYWAYKLVESVAPWLSLPDLAASGLRTVRGLPKAAREVTALGEEAGAASQRLASQQEAIAAYKEAHGIKLDRANIMTKTQRMQAKANQLTSDMQRAHAKLQKAGKELRLLRVIEGPACSQLIRRISRIRHRRFLRHGTGRRKLGDFLTTYIIPHTCWSPAKLHRTRRGTCAPPSNFRSPSVRAPGHRHEFYKASARGSGARPHPRHSADRATGQPPPRRPAARRTSWRRIRCCVRVASC